MWLQEKAQAGDSEVLVELRGQSTEVARHIIVLERVLAAVDERPDTGKLLDQADQYRLRYTVGRNGDVTYSSGGRELLLYTGSKIYMIDQSSAVIEQGLRLAAQKWGEKMTLAGDDEFIRQTIQVVAVKNMHIEFADHAHNNALQLERDNLRRGQEAIAKHSKALAEEQENNEKLAAQAPRRQPPGPTEPLEQQVFAPNQD